jgi:hypothetical protein
MVTRSVALALAAAIATAGVAPKAPRPLAVVPFQLLANGVFVPVYVNGKGPFFFELDTGSDMSMVASETAGAIGLETKGSMQGMGAGSSSFGMAMIPHLELTLPGGPEMSTTEAGSASMAGLWPLVGRRIDGDLGYDVLRRYVVKIDYERRVVTLYDPATYRYDGPGTTIPFTLWGDYDPQISGELLVSGQPPIPVRYTLDSGAGGTIVTSPLVRSHHLRESATAVLPQASHGIGNGESQDIVARLEGLRIGPYLIDRPLVALSQDTVGSLTHAALGVNVGGNILRRFTVIIDYAHARLILEPNAEAREPIASDASGLVLEARGKDFKTFRVRAVVPGSPAAEAGVQDGDVLAEIEGQDIGRYALWQLQDALKQAGRVYRVHLRRGDRDTVATLRLRSLL